MTRLFTTPQGIELDLDTLHESFRIRCSAIGTIMKNDRSGKAMGETAKTYLENWVKQQLYGRKQNITSKYLTKGIECEASSIELASDYFGWGMVAKNETQYEDEYMTGTPDLVLANFVADIKNSWDCFTFPLLDDKIPIDGYADQLQGYMHLTKKTSAKLIYTLMTAPIEQVEREARNRAGWGNEVDAELFDAVLKEMSYDSTPVSLRIKSFELEYSPERIEQINKRVDEAREYIAQIVKGIKL